MRDLPDGDAVVPLDEARSGAFVLRAWFADDVLRARVRSARDLADHDGTEIVDLHGSTESVVADAVELLRRWLDDFARDAPVTPP